jgi:hypothetical protein
VAQIKALGPLRLEVPAEGFPELAELEEVTA